MSDWPHDKIRSVAVGYIRKHATPETDWRFTRIDALPEQLGRIVHLDQNEQPILSCFIDAQRWYAMTTARIFGVVRGSQFNCAPLDVTQWRWGDLKMGGRPGVSIATLALANGTHLRIPYETGPATLAPIYYERFWTTQYPVLDQGE